MPGALAAVVMEVKGVALSLHPMVPVVAVMGVREAILLPVPKAAAEAEDFSVMEELPVLVVAVVAAFLLTVELVMGTGKPLVAEAEEVGPRTNMQELAEPVPVS